MAGNVPRNEKGQVLPGAKLNPGGRAYKRQRDLAERLLEKTHDFRDIEDAYVKVATDTEHKDWAKAAAWIDARVHGPLAASPLDDAADELETLSKTELADRLAATAAELRQRAQEEHDANGSVGGVVHQLRPAAPTPQAVGDGVAGVGAERARRDEQQAPGADPDLGE